VRESYDRNTVEFILSHLTLGNDHDADANLPKSSGSHLHESLPATDIARKIFRRIDREN
jgi:hypothetical protein